MIIVFLTKANWPKKVDDATAYVTKYLKLQKAQMKASVEVKVENEAELTQTAPSTPKPTAESPRVQKAGSSPGKIK